MFNKDPASESSTKQLNRVSELTEIASRSAMGGGNAPWPTLYTATDVDTLEERFVDVRGVRYTSPHEIRETKLDQCKRESNRSSDQNSSRTNQDESIL